MSTTSADRLRRRSRQAGFTLLELVLAITLFAFIIVEVLADRETSIKMSADARMIQMVRYLAQSKIDEIRHDPSQFNDTDSGDFSELDPEDPIYERFTWSMEMRQLVAVGASEESADEYLFPEDEDAEPTASSAEGEGPGAYYVRRLTVIVAYEAGDVERPDLSIKIVTYIPAEEEEEE